MVALDVGPGVRASTETSFFSQAKKCLTNILQRKVNIIITIEFIVLGWNSNFMTVDYE